ncbi:Retrovirus-related Pol polyprotein from transposon 17.6, partial [Mucuna pruriens]
MIRKASDYTDLNKACPKDPYPLPSIDRLFYGRLLGLQPNPNAPHNEEKIVFITDDDAFYCKVMPFGLKNVGATYQRLMDKIFKEVMGVDVEVYVDDMVVKSAVASEHRKALERVFGILRKQQLRLNPEKCPFGVHVGKFLGFMLTERGIEANLKKCQVVISMWSLQSIKEVKQLMGRVTTLSRFISQAAETAMPIFGTLRKGGNFIWTPECEEAFLWLKAMLATPPVLTRSCLGIPLNLYIFVSDAVVSAVLIQEREGEQCPVYITSKVLQGAERRYQRIEKAALAFVITLRRLHLHFQNYGIVLRKPDLAGRMVAWSVQLSEFDISFERRGHVKAQALANFITKLTPIGTPSVEEGVWYLSVDGSSNQTGSGVGIILEGPEGILIEQSLHFEFRASNNQAEYEALLAGMKLPRELEVKKLMVKSDSKLVTRQVNGEY